MQADDYDFHQALSTALEYIGNNGFTPYGERNTWRENGVPVLRELETETMQ